MTMEETEAIRVPVAQLKAKLSEHLRAVQAGSTLVVVSHDRPVALLGPPPGAASGLAIRPQRQGPLPLSRLRLPTPSEPRLGIEALDLLLQERSDR
jgi:prevent-host-death family protein